jgi:excisionase family DNA binding protein
MQAKVEQDLLSTQEAAALLGVAAVTVNRWIRIGTLPAVRVGPRLVRVRREDLGALLSPARPLPQARATQ